MSTSSQKTPKIVELAGCLESDIRQKGLTPGDPYLSTLEAARMLGVSTVAANRALQLLVKREVLHRRQRSGTFIAQPSDNGALTTINRIHLLVHQNFLKTEGLLADGVILGIQEKLPQAEIQFNFLPANDEGAYTNQVVSETLSSSRTEGFVMVRSPLSVQRVVQASGLPAVIHGTPFPSITSVPWIERDHYQGGRLATARLIRDGFRSLILFSREMPMPGDYATFDAVRDEMSAARLPINAITWRPLHSDTEVVCYLVQDLLHNRKGPQGFVCRSRPMADAAAEAIAAEKLELGVDAGIVLLDAYQSSARQTPPYPHLMSTMTPEVIGQHIGHMLLLQARGIKPNPDREIIPQELREPNARRADL